MTPESHEQIVRLEAEHLKEKNALQIELAKRLYGAETDARFEEWILKYSQKFRELFEQELESNPAFIEELADPAMHGDVLARFAAALYGDEDMKKAA